MRQALKTISSDKQPLRFVDDKKTLAEYNVVLDTHIILRDMGPQIGYRDVSLLFISYMQVFVYEYLGPLVIMAVLYLRPSFIYGPCTKEYTKQAL